jgi:2-hydroxychromene-2-carboxylate isomerase
MTATAATLEFWYDHASPYSYLTAKRIDALATSRGLTIIWQPFLLGPIFKAQGWNTSPFNLYPAKGRYMVRDLQRLAASRGLPFVMPPTFPANSLLAARVATCGVQSGWTARFSRDVFEAAFAHGQDIADRQVVAGLITALGLDATEILEIAQSEPTKEALRASTKRAMAAGIFGAPTFRSPNDEIFWGDDRLEMALQEVKA